MKMLIGSVTSLVITIVIGVVLITILAPGADINPLIALVAPTIASLGALGAVGMVKSDTGKMLNGVMDKKIQENVTTVLVDQGLAENGLTAEAPAKPVHDPTNTIPVL